MSSMQAQSEGSKGATPRRWFIRSGLLALGAGVANLLTPSSASAADGDALVLGDDNEATSRTHLSATAPGTSDSALEVVNTGVSGSGIHASGVGTGIRAEGITGVVGGSNSANGSGVLGEDLTDSPFGRGVQGISHFGRGVYAVSPFGQALKVDGVAVFSRSGRITVPAGRNQAVVAGVTSPPQV